MGGKQGGIFQDWFKNIATLIFLQSFHAIFLAFIVEIIGKISNVENQITTFKPVAEGAQNGEGVLAIMTIVSVMSLIKMEKMIKGIFGIQDSKFLGGIGDNMTKSMASIGSAISMAKRTAEPFKQAGEAKKKITESRQAQSKAKTSITDSENKLKELEKRGPKSGQSNEAYQRELARAEDKVESSKKQLKESKDAEKKAQADYDVAHQKAYLRAGSTGAALSFGMGATDNIGSAVTVANLVDMPLDYVGDKHAAKTGYGKASKKMEEEIYQEKEKMARDEIRSAGVFQEGTKEFKKAVDELLSKSDFNERANTKLSGKLQTKFDIDMKIPQSVIVNEVKQMSNDWLKSGGRFNPVAATSDRASEGRGGRRQSRKVEKEGIHYGSDKVDYM